MIDSVADRIRGVGAALSRVTLAPLLVRLAVALAALVAVVLAYPVEVLATSLAPLLLLAAVLPAVWPRRFWPTAAVLVVVLGWVLRTAASDEPVGLVRLLVLSALLYLVHNLCALATFLPYDAVVAPGLLVGWLRRAGGVLLATALLAVLLLGVADRGAAGAFPLAAIGGVAVAVLTAGLLAGLFRRR